MLTSTLNYDTSEAVYLVKPISLEELKRDYPNIKGIRVGFSNTGFQALKINHDEYLEKLMDIFDLEELIIDRRNRLTKLPKNILKPSLKHLEIYEMGDGVKYILESNNGCKLKRLHLDCSFVKPSIELLASKSLNQVVLTNSNEISSLNQATNLTSLQLSPSNDKLDLDFSNFPKLVNLSIYSSQKIKGLFDFSKLKELKNVALNNLEYLPRGWENLNQIESLHLNYVGSGTSTEILKFDVYPNLKFLNLHINLNFSGDLLGEMPSLQYMHLGCESEFSVKLSAKLFTSNSLTSITLSGALLPTKMPLNHVYNNISLSNCFFDDDIESLNYTEYLTINNCQNESLNSDSWQNLNEVKTIIFSNSLILKELPPFNSKNTNLEYISINGLSSLKTLPETWNICPQLSEISFSGVGNLKMNNWESFPSIQKIQAYEGVTFSKETLLWSSLKSIVAGYYRNHNVDFEDISKITQDLTISKETKLVIGSLLFEDSFEIEKINNFKEVFLGIFNTKSFRIRQLAWDKLDLINETKTINLEILSQKSIALLGKTKNVKSYYKEKLVSLGSNYKAKVEANTEIIVVGESFELPDKFWDYSHQFISEVALDTLIKDFQLGYIQTLESNELDNLRELIWSNAVENDKIVIEMIKGGGIADTLIPDLMVVAKTSQDDNVKNSLKRLLKAKISTGSQKILSDKTNLKHRCPYDIYHAYDPEFDVAQFAVTYYKREKNLLSHFFSAHKSKENPYRNNLFMETYGQFLVKPHRLTVFWNFTDAEFSFILSQPELTGKLKVLGMGLCEIRNVMPALLKHKDTLEALHFNTEEKDLPTELTDFKKLKKLTISASNLTDASLDVSEMKKLKEYKVYGR